MAKFSADHYPGEKYPRRVRYDCNSPQEAKGIINQIRGLIGSDPILVPNQPSTDEILNGTALSLQRGKIKGGLNQDDQPFVLLYDSTYSPDAFGEILNQISRRRHLPTPTGSSQKS